MTGISRATSGKTAPVTFNSDGASRVEIPATPLPSPQRLLGSLHAFRAAEGVGELSANAAGHGAQHFHGVGSIRRIQKLQCPLGHVDRKSTRLNSSHLGIS